MRAWLLCGFALLVGGASCVQILDDSPYSQDGLPTDGTEEPCATAANCTRGDACTVTTCSAAGFCVYTPLPDGPHPAQIVGDCLRIECADGVELRYPDEADVPDDEEPCTEDLCKGKTPIHTPLADESACQIGESSGLCAMGQCRIECNTQKPCDDGNPCTDAACNGATGQCIFPKLDGVPTPGVTPIEGDCTQRICVNGVDTTIVDDADVPVDGNVCTLDVCMMGVPSNPPVEMGLPCMFGAVEVCDGAGQCVACNVPDDCVLLPPDDDCQVRTCVGNACGQAFAPGGTAIATQVAGDCMKVVCDGVGGTAVVVDDTDLPDDGNACTEDICTNGVPSNPNGMIGVPCGQDGFCDGMGACLGCFTPASCPGVDDFCKVRTCVNNLCGVEFTAPGTALLDGQTAMDCKVVACDGQGNAVTEPDISDIPVDGNPCTQDVCSPQGVPSNPPEAAGTSCDPNGNAICDGAGGCERANGQACAADSECQSAFCVDGVCCESACTTTCRTCAATGSEGVCANLPRYADDTYPANACTGTKTCNGAGACKKANGQTCSLASECASGNCAGLFPKTCQP